MNELGTEKKNSLSFSWLFYQRLTWFKRKENVLKQRYKKPIKIDVEIRIIISWNILVLKITEKAKEKNKRILK